MTDDQINLKCGVRFTNQSSQGSGRAQFQSEDGGPRAARPLSNPPHVAFDLTSDVLANRVSMVSRLAHRGILGSLGGIRTRHTGLNGGEEIRLITIVTAEHLR